MNPVPGMSYCISKGFDLEENKKGHFLGGPFYFRFIVVITAGGGYPCNKHWSFYPPEPRKPVWKLYLLV